MQQQSKKYSQKRKEITHNHHKEETATLKITYAPKPPNKGSAQDLPLPIPNTDGVSLLLRETRSFGLLDNCYSLPALIRHHLGAFTDRIVSKDSCSRHLSGHKQIKDRIEIVLGIWIWCSVVGAGY